MASSLPVSSGWSSRAAMAGFCLRSLPREPPREWRPGQQSVAGQLQGTARAARQPQGGRWMHSGRHPHSFTVMASWRRMCHAPLLSLAGGSLRPGGGGGGGSWVLLWQRRRSLAFLPPTCKHGTGPGSAGGWPRPGEPATSRQPCCGSPVPNALQALLDAVGVAERLQAGKRRQEVGRKAQLNSHKQLCKPRHVHSGAGGARSGAPLRLRHTPAACARVEGPANASGHGAGGYAACICPATHCSSHRSNLSVTIKRERTQN